MNVEVRKHDVKDLTIVSVAFSPGEVERACEYAKTKGIDLTKNLSNPPSSPSDVLNKFAQLAFVLEEMNQAQPGRPYATSTATAAEVLGAA